MLKLHVAPDGPPKAIQIKTNLTSMEISWEPVDCIQQNSAIKSYTVLYWRTSKSILTNKSDVTSADVTNLTVRKLTPSSSYMVEVQAVNEYGDKSPAYNLTANTTDPEGM